MADGRQFDELLSQFRGNAIDRRQFLTRASAAGLGAAASMALLGVKAGAQDSTPEATPERTPSSAGPGEVVQLLATREEYKAALYAAYPPTENAPKGGEYVAGNGSDISTTNAILAGDTPTNPFLGQIFEGLVGSSPVDGDYVPALADSCALSEDGLTLTYTLHPGVTWHDGTPFTSADVVLSHDAQSTPETGSSYTGTFLAAVASYRAVDDATFELTLLDTYARVTVFGNTYCPIVPAHIWNAIPFPDWAADGGSTGTDPGRVIGTGPFTFIEWQSGTQATVARFDGYWDDVPNLDTVTIRKYPNSTAAIEALVAGEIDSYENPDASDVQTLQDAGLTVDIYDSYSFGFYGYNLDPAKTPLFQQAEVRKALFYGIDRQSIVDNIQLGFAEVANGTQPTLSVAYAPDEINTVYGFDVAMANQLLDTAGWALGDDGVRANADGVRLEFELMYGAGSAATDQIVAYMQDAWSQIGAAMTPNPVDFNTVLVPTITGTYDYDIAFLGFVWDYSGDQRAMFGTDFYGPNGFNFMRYSNPAYDDLANRANVEQDADVRRQLLIDASNIVNDDLPVGIISFRQDRFGINKDRVQNYNANAYGGTFWSTTYASIIE